MLSDKLLTYLKRVQKTGQDRWIASCPGHDDKHPSLAIREVGDRILLHCFAGCSAYEIVSDVGLELSDLFPKRVTHEGNRPLSRPFPAADILRCLCSETTYLMVCASDLSKGEKLDDKSQKRLLQSASRFRSALTVGGLA